MKTGQRTRYEPATLLERRALACLDEAYHLAGQVRPWPGWDLRGGSLALFRRDGGMFLCGHDRLPRRAVPVAWPDSPQRPPLFYLKGQPRNLTDTCATLVYLGRFTAFVPLETVGRDAGDAVEMVALIWQEAFHAFQRALRRVDVPVAVPYPEDSPVNNALGNVEGRLLLDALRAPQEELAAHRRALALIRRERRAQLDDDLVEYERFTEFYEGLATYVACRALEVAGQEGYRPHPAVSLWVAEEAEYRRAALDLRAARLAGLLTVNRRGQGANRRRFFLTGMGLAYFLDRLDPEWKEKVQRPGVGLDEVLEAGVPFDGGEGDDRVIAETECRYDYVRRLEEERAHARELRRRKREILAEALGAEGTLLVIDVSQLRLTETRLDHDRVETINERVRVHTGSAFFQYGPTTLYFHGVPVVEDRVNGLLEVRLPHRLRMLGDEVPLRLLRPAEFTDGFELNAGGIRVRARRGYIQPADGAIYLKIVR